MIEHNTLRRHDQDGSVVQMQQEVSVGTILVAS